MKCEVITQYASADVDPEPRPCPEDAEFAVEKDGEEHSMCVEHAIRAMVHFGAVIRPLL